MSTVLYDAPGPRARVRNRLLAVITVVIVVAIIGFVLYRFAMTGQFTAEKWELFRYTAVWRAIGMATLTTLSAFIVAAIGSLLLGLVLSIGRVSSHRWVRWPVTVFTEIFRAIPVLILMMIMYYGLPTLGLEFINPYIAVVVGLILYNGSVLAEVFRSGIESLPSGQGEAGYAIGLRKTGVMSIILYPQAIRAMMPVIISQLVVVLKDTALGFIVTFQELLYLAKFYGSQVAYGAPIIPSTIIFGSIYIALCLLLAGLAKWVEVRTKRSKKLPTDSNFREDLGAAETKAIALQSESHEAGGRQI
ncbi:amino acid ABC transporter permease [Paramicrobacterium agarici]|uniref:amino acid ABC transporter permease n=1 Tax=Paramicrobacterium agarici TaxID=630514 RepID=UPI00114D9CBB|nr:ABC transporter permease subunit [Microbacterium agarici]TQO24128.1 glutamate transport system permease protein [Microbacterium agarici]